MFGNPAENLGAAFGLWHFPWFMLLCGLNQNHHAVLLTQIHHKCVFYSVFVSVNEVQRRLCCGRRMGFLPGAAKQRWRCSVCPRSSAEPWTWGLRANPALQKITSPIQQWAKTDLYNGKYTLLRFCLCVLYVFSNKASLFCFDITTCDLDFKIRNELVKRQDENCFNITKMVWSWTVCRFLGHFHLKRKRFWRRYSWVKITWHWPTW